MAGTGSGKQMTDGREKKQAATGLENRYEYFTAETRVLGWIKSKPPTWTCDFVNDTHTRTERGRGSRRRASDTYLSSRLAGAVRFP